MNSTVIDSLAASAPEAGAAQPWHAALLSSIKRGIAQIVEKRRIRRDLDVLLALDDRLLADVGVHRSELEYTVRHGRGFLDASTRGDHRISRSANAQTIA